MTGATETLHQLNVGRFGHACGIYLSEQGDNVLLITGGFNNIDLFLGSTECLEGNAGSWSLTTPLPSARAYLSGAVLENNFFVFGGYEGLPSRMSNILMFNTTSHTW